MNKFEKLIEYIKQYSQSFRLIFITKQQYFLTKKSLLRVPEDNTVKPSHSTFHTSTGQLAEIANKTKPKLLVLTHQLPFGMSKESLMKELQDRYKGAVVYGNDLDTF